MHILKPAVAAALIATAAAAEAQIVNDVWVGDQATALERPVFAYPADRNLCPGGRVPVVAGDAICCGTPTAPGYGMMPAAVRHHAPAPRGRLVEGAKGAVHD
jgi:hypothetical protein